ncbi:hypothetical protein AAMO2058_000318400 [Amorphochlora amoebiformis]
MLDRVDSKVSMSQGVAPNPPASSPDLSDHRPTLSHSFKCEMNMGRPESKHDSMLDDIATTKEARESGDHYHHEPSEPRKASSYNNRKLSAEDREFYALAESMYDSVQFLHATLLWESVVAGCHDACLDILNFLDDYKTNMRANLDDHDVQALKCYISENEVPKFSIPKAIDDPIYCLWGSFTFLVEQAEKLILRTRVVPSCKRLNKDAPVLHMLYPSIMESMTGDDFLTLSEIMFKSRSI